HLAELGPERVGVRLHEPGERLHEAVDDERFPLVAAVARCGHACEVPAWSVMYVVPGGRTAAPLRHRRDDLLRRQRKGAYANSQRVRHRVGDRGRRRTLGAFADAEWRVVTPGQEL